MENFYLNQLAHQIHQTAKEKGFWNEPRNTGELLMLVVSELGEALEADRKKRHCLVNVKEQFFGDNPWKYSDPVMDHAQFTAKFDVHVKDTFEDEIADAVIRLLDLCAGRGIDIDAHIAAKMKYNSSRPYLHGKAY